VSPKKFAKVGKCGVREIDDAVERDRLLGSGDAWGRRAGRHGDSGNTGAQRAAARHGSPRDSPRRRLAAPADAPAAVVGLTGSRLAA